MDKIIIDKTNAFLAFFGAILTYVFGEHWILFAGYLLLNVIDFITGIIADRISGKISSVKGTIGLLKKLSYWLMIVVGFLMSVLFIEIGTIINVNLGITSIIGWMVLIYLIINEIRSIIENLVEAGYNPPKILTKGLEVANRVIDNVGDNVDSRDEENS